MQVLTIAEQQQDLPLLLEAHQELGGTLSNQGNFAQALDHQEQGIIIYDSRKHHSHTIQYGQDPRVSCLSRAAHDLWFLGYPDRALAKSHEALALAQELAHPQRVHPMLPQLVLPFLKKAVSSAPLLPANLLCQSLL